MTIRSSRNITITAAILFTTALLFAAEQRMAPGGKWKFNDPARPKPPVIDPGTPSTLDQPGKPPSDAIILFDGKDLSKWKGDKGDPTWKIENGYMEITPKAGGIATKDRFGDCQIHIEWASPSEVKGSSQGRGNSGVFLSGHGEIQVLDSFNNDTYADGHAAALYGKYPPLVNASRKPGEWQSFDIIFEGPRPEEAGQPARPAKLTVLHNGVVVHHALDTGGRSKEISLSLQDHSNPVRYRNIWVRPIKGYDAQ